MADASDDDDDDDDDDVSSSGGDSVVDGPRRQRRGRAGRLRMDVDLGESEDVGSAADDSNDEDFVYDAQKEGKLKGASEQWTRGKRPNGIDDEAAVNAVLDAIDDLQRPEEMDADEMLEDASWVDAYLARNAENLREQHASLASALAAEGIAVTPARAGMFVWIDLGGSLREATWEEEWRLWTAMFERAKIVATPGRDCKSAAPGCFRLCFASVDREAMLAGVKRLGELLRAYE